MFGQLGHIIHLAEQMMPDELAVLVSVAEGLTRGRSQYGPLRIKDPGRQWTQEALEEARDAVVYLTAELLRRDRQQAAPEPQHPNHPYNIPGVATVAD